VSPEFASGICLSPRRLQPGESVPRLALLAEATAQLMSPKLACPRDLPTRNLPVPAVPGICPLDLPCSGTLPMLRD
jgi:hypothetical protein